MGQLDDAAAQALAAAVAAPPHTYLWGGLEPVSYTHLQEQKG